MLSSVPTAIDAARRLMNNSRWDEADIVLEDVLSAEPGHVDALVLKGSSFLMRGQRERAFLLFSELAGVRGDRADIAANLGAIHQVEGRIEEACFCFERAVMLEPEDGNHRASLSGALLSSGKPAQAREQAQALLAIARRLESVELAAEAHSLSSRIAMAEGRLGAAQRALRNALDLRPDHVPDLVQLSEILARLGEGAEALTLAERAYLAAPAEHEHGVLLARRLLETGRFAEAERHVRRTVAASPFHVEANHVQAQLLILTGAAQRGLTGFSNLVRRTPENADVLSRMSALLRLSGDLEKALAFAEHAVARSGDSPEARARRDELLLALGRIDQVWPVPAVAPDAPTAFSVPLGLPAGDVLLLARFAARLCSPGQLTPCYAEESLLPLLEGVVGLAPLPASGLMDALPITALPSLFGAFDIAPAPYLAVESERHARWAEILAEFPRPLIGVVWENGLGGLPLATLAPVLQEMCAGQGTLVSLAFGDQRAALADHPAIVDAGAHFTDARDLMAAIAQLDVVAGSDGLAMHAAGALGVRAVIAVAAHRPWAWAHREGRSLWYPSVHVVQQQDPAGWQATVSQLAAKAEELVG